MTRAEVLAEFTVNERGLITNPGKFEGEMLYAPHFYEALLSGFADDDIAGVALFEVTADDRAEFPELAADTFAVALEEDSVGFAFCQQLTKAEYDGMVAQLEAIATESNEAEFD